MNAGPLPSPNRSVSCTAASFLLALAILAGPVALRAQEVYKSVDSQGHVTYSDRPPPQPDQSGVAVVDAQDPPRVLHFCWTNCFTLKGDKGVYTRTDGTDESWTIERFTPTSFVLHRRDAPAAWNGFHPEVTYAGRVANERMTDVTVDGRPVREIAMAWGSALNTLPGSNAERDWLASQGSLQSDGEPASADGAEPQLLTAGEAPPPLPEEGQPENAVEGTLWVPGYWGWTANSFYWVRGAWMRPPRVGLLWTPGYWVLVGTVYVFHPGYWGPRVGYYGGINYGYGYYGSGYSGGRWEGKRFLYNAAVSHVNTRVIHDSYREPPRMDLAGSRESFRVMPGNTTLMHLPKEHVSAPESDLAPVARTAHNTLQRHSTAAATRSFSGAPERRTSQPRHEAAPATRRESAESSTTRKVEKEPKQPSPVLHTRPGVPVS